MYECVSYQNVDQRPCKVWRLLPPASVCRVDLFMLEMRTNRTHYTTCTKCKLPLHFSSRILFTMCTSISSRAVPVRNSHICSSQKQLRGQPVFLVHLGRLADPESGSGCKLFISQDSQDSLHTIITGTGTTIWMYRRCVLRVAWTVSNVFLFYLRI